MIFFQNINNVQKQPPRVFCNKKVLKIFAKFTGKEQENTCVRVFLLVTVLKQKLWNFFCKLCEIFKNAFSTEQLRITASICNIASNLQRLVLLKCFSEIIPGFQSYKYPVFLQHRQIQLSGNLFVWCTINKRVRKSNCVMFIIMLDMAYAVERSR